jgi:MobC-like protein
MTTKNNKEELLAEDDRKIKQREGQIERLIRSLDLQIVNREYVTEPQRRLLLDRVKRVRQLIALRNQQPTDVTKIRHQIESLRLEASDREMEILHNWEIDGYSNSGNDSNIQELFEPEAIPVNTSKTKIKPQKELRTRILKIRLTPNEFSRLEFQARIRGKQSNSGYVRSLIIGAKSKVVPEVNARAYIRMGKMAQELNAIGTNLNQAVKAINTALLAENRIPWDTIRQSDLKAIADKIIKINRFCKRVQLRLIGKEDDREN